MINGHGNNLYQYEAEQIEVDFSSNIAFNNHSQRICEYLRGVIDAIGDYPDPEAKQLTSALAEQQLVSGDQIVITNGSAEAFYLIAHLLKRNGCDKTAIMTPSFAEYEDSCRTYDHEIDYISFGQLNDLDLSCYGSLWIGIPNNPNGVRVEYSQIRELAAKYPACTFVVDRAYNELSNVVEHEWQLLDNIIIVDSFTKTYGIPGLRLGYIIAKSETVAQLSTIRPPWSVNALSQLAGLYIIEHHDELQPDMQELIGESKYLQREIEKIDGFRVVPSDCNFFLVEITAHETLHAAELQHYLAQNYRLLIRDCSNFRGLTPRHFRIAAQNREACDKLITALKSWRH